MPAPLTAQNFAQELALVLGQVPEKFAVAVSGGADSMALMHLANAAFEGRFTVLTVNHQLRAEAAEEVQFVASSCAALAIPLQGLTWAEGPAVAHTSGNLQAQARAARYDLMAAWCRANEVDVLLTAHHGTDQAETVLLSLSRASGVDGLAAMPEMREMNGVRLVRPLLTATKEDLVGFCRAQGIAWVEDPSNENTRFDRVRLRQASDQLASLGISQNALRQTAEHMARAKDALDHYTAAYLKDFAVLDCLGGIALSLKPLRATPQEIRIRVLGRVLKAAGGRPNRPDAQQLKSLLDDFERVPEGKTTLGGTVVGWSGNQATIRREARHLPKELSLTDQTAVSWDQRALWRVRQPMSALTLRGLSHEHWNIVGGKKPDVAFPVELRPTVPAVYDDEGPLAVPVIGYWREPAAQAAISCDWSPLQRRLGVWTGA